MVAGLAPPKGGEGLWLASFFYLLMLPPLAGTWTSILKMRQPL